MRNANWPGYRYLTGGAVLLLLGGIVIVAMRGRWQAALTLSGFAIAAGGFLYLFRKQLPALVNFAVVAALLINAAGYAWDLYTRFAWFDEVLHGYTLFALTLLLGLLAYNKVLGGFHRHQIIFMLAIASFGLAVGALWEIVEWVFDMFTAGNSILGKRDTMIDLIIDGLGALVAGGLSIAILRDQLHAEGQPRDTAEPQAAGEQSLHQRTVGE